MRLREAEMKRLQSQSERIITRLRQGPATNYELADISLKYTGRVSELRKRGYHIQCRTVSPRGLGITVYKLT